MKLGLGTVQFGMNYGISNVSGITPPDEARNILRIAEKSKLKYLDTASLYGESEQVLGNILPHDSSFEIITKTPRLSSITSVSEKIKELKTRFNESLFKLKTEAVTGLLVHDGNDLIGEGGKEIYSALNELKDHGLVEKIGASVYSEHEINAIIDRYDIDLVQLPINIFDQRLLKNKTLDCLKAKNIEIHARSAFLQGLAFINPKNLDSRFSEAQPLLSRLHETAHHLDVTVSAICLGFLNSLQQIDCIVCGVNTRQQLEELVRASNTQIPQIDYTQFAIINEDILNPSHWNKINERKCDNHPSVQ